MTGEDEKRISKQAWVIDQEYIPINHTRITQPRSNYTKEKIWYHHNFMDQSSIFNMASVNRISNDFFLSKNSRRIELATKVRIYKICLSNNRVTKKTDGFILGICGLSVTTYRFRELKTNVAFCLTATAVLACIES